MPRASSAAGRYWSRLGLVFGLTLAYALVEGLSSYLTGSLALLADAGHMLTDGAALGLALLALWLAGRPAPATHSYGYYRLEILAALANALLLLGITGYVFFEAYRRFQAPPEVQSLPMLVVATLGLGVNLAGAAALRPGARESLNVRGAFLHVLSDALGSVAAILAGAIMLATGWGYADPLLSALIGLFVLRQTWWLLHGGLAVLLESAPSHIDPKALERAIRHLPGVLDVHDLHLWTITSGLETMTAHVAVAKGTPTNAILQELQRLMEGRFGIGHSTFQVEEKGKDSLDIECICTFTRELPGP